MRSFTIGVVVMALIWFRAEVFSSSISSIQRRANSVRVNLSSLVIRLLSVLV